MAANTLQLAVIDRPLKNGSVVRLWFEWFCTNMATVSVAELKESTLALTTGQGIWFAVIFRVVESARKKR